MSDQCPTCDEPVVGRPVRWRCVGPWLDASSMVDMLRGHSNICGIPVGVWRALLGLLDK